MAFFKNESTEVLEVASEIFRFTLLPGEKKSVQLLNAENSICISKVQPKKQAFEAVAFVLAHALNLLNFLIVQELPLKVMDFIEYPIRFEIGTDNTVVLLTDDSESNAVCKVQCNGINAPFQLICDKAQTDKAVKEYRMYILSCFWLPFLVLVFMSILLIIKKLYIVAFILLFIVGMLCFWLYMKEKAEIRNINKKQ